MLLNIRGRWRGDPRLAEWYASAILLKRIASGRALGASLRYGDLPGLVIVPFLFFFLAVCSARMGVFRPCAVSVRVLFGRAVSASQSLCEDSIR